jgi:hypothetical protein
VIDKCTRGMSRRITNKGGKARPLYKTEVTRLHLLLRSDSLSLGISLDVAGGLGRRLAVVDGVAQESILWQTEYGVDLVALSSCNCVSDSSVRNMGNGCYKGPLAPSHTFDGQVTRPGCTWDTEDRLAGRMRCCSTLDFTTTGVLLL